MQVLITATFCLLHFSACYELINLGNVNEKRDLNRFISRDRSLLIDISNVADLEKYCPHRADGKFQPCKDKFSNIKIMKSYDKSDLTPWKMPLSRYLRVRAVSVH